MVPLGLGLSIESVVSSEAAVVIEDYMWELLSAGNLAPRDIVTDFSDSWDVSSTELTPAVSPKEEGYWNVDANGDLTPK